MSFSFVSIALSTLRIRDAENHVLPQFLLKVSLSQCGIVGFHVSFGTPFIVCINGTGYALAWNGCPSMEAFQPAVADFRPPMIMVDPALVFHLCEAVVFP